MDYIFILLHCNALHVFLWYIILYQLLTISKVSLYLFEKLLLGFSFNTMGQSVDIEKRKEKQQPFRDMFWTYGHTCNI